jgi:hypothetical protein
MCCRRMNTLLLIKPNFARGHMEPCFHDPVYGLSVIGITMAITNDAGQIQIFFYVNFSSVFPPINRI